MNIKGPKGRGEYSTIVYIDGNTYVAEDNVGTVVEEGTTVATVIQAAIDREGKVFIKDGTYTCTTALSLVDKDVVLEGESREGTKIQNNTTDIINAKMTALHAAYPCIRNIYLDGVDSSFDGIDAEHICWSEFLRNVRIENCVNGIQMKHCITVDNYSVKVGYCTKGILLENTAIADCINAVNFFGGVVDHCSDVGVKMSGSIENCKFSGMVFEHSTNGQVLITPNNSVLPIGNIIQNGWLEGPGPLIKLTGTDQWVSTRATKIEGNYFAIDANKTIIDIAAARNTLISGNMFYAGGAFTGTIAINVANGHNTLIKNNIRKDTGFTLSINPAGTATTKQHNQGDDI